MVLVVLGHEPRAGNEGARSGLSRSALKPSPDPMIQLEDDIAFQRKSWLVERIGWGVMLTILVAALAGLFASGPLSSKNVESADSSAIVRYERFARAQAPVCLVQFVYP